MRETEYKGNEGWIHLSGLILWLTLCQLSTSGMLFFLLCSRVGWLLQYQCYLLCGFIALSNPPPLSHKEYALIYKSPSLCQLLYQESRLHRLCAIVLTTIVFVSSVQIYISTLLLID